MKLIIGKWDENCRKHYWTQHIGENFDNQCIKHKHTQFDGPSHNSFIFYLSLSHRHTLFHSFTSSFAVWWLQKPNTTLPFMPCTALCNDTQTFSGSSDERKSPFSFNYFIRKVCLTFDSINTLIFIFCLLSLPFNSACCSSCFHSLSRMIFLFFMAGPTAPKRWQFHLKFRIILKGFK